MPIDVDEKLQQIHDAGNRPARHGALVKVVRRVLWPFVRPYHRRQLELLDEILGSAQGSDIAALGRDLAALRADVRAAVNRMSLLENERLPAVGNTFLANTHAGLLYLLRGDFISETVASTGGWDTHLLPVFEEAAGEGTAVDAGAHVGLHTLALAPRFGRVMSFEANPFLVRLLRANVAVNAHANVTCVNKALYSSAVELALGGGSQQEVDVPWLTGDAWSGGDRNLGAICFVPGGSNVFRTTATTIDSCGIEDLRLLKIDCQGADGEVILGAAETIRRCRPVVVFEWEDVLARNHSAGLDDVRGLLADCSYELAELHRHNDKQVDYVARPR
ncbi:FkbM family methyltransferase [bacterium]|nr:FkbM family methyltransferase [bacterium]